MSWIQKQRSLAVLLVVSLIITNGCAENDRQTSASQRIAPTEARDKDSKVPNSGSAKEKRIATH